MGTIPSQASVAAVEWNTKLSEQAAALLVAHNARYDHKSIKDLADEMTVGQVRDIFSEFNAEFVRLEAMKQALISAKDQLKAAVNG